MWPHKCVWSLLFMSCYLIPNLVDFNQSIWKIWIFCIFALLNVASHALIVLSLRSELDKESAKWSNIMLWAACYACFFGFLRSGEVTVPSQKDYDSTAHLSHGDVTCTFDSRQAKINIKASSTNPFRKGVTIYVGCTDNDLCPRWQHWLPIRPLGAL